MLTVLQDIGDLRPVNKPVVLAIGFFDGVHLGHQAVIAAAKEKAAAMQGEVWTLTFEPHPRKIIHPETAPALLTSTKHKLHLLEQAGVHGCILMPFAPSFRKLSARDFMSLLAESIPSLKHVVVGSNWTFGHKGRGSIDLLKEWADEQGISASSIEPVLHKGKPVSSTRIRLSVREGLLDEAAQMLGRPFSICGEVIKGRGVGREIGFPTANIEPRNEVFPPCGIYAVYAEIDENIFKGAGYIGHRPTFEQRINEWVLEVFFFDVDFDIYEKEVIVYFIKKIRDDRKFESLDELSLQIGKDVKAAKTILAEKMSGRE